MPWPKHPTHNYSEDTKNMILAQVGIGTERGKKNKISVSHYCSLPSTPHRSTIYRWKKKALEAGCSVVHNKPRGRPRRISKMEKLVVGGWVLSRNKQHLPATVEDIQAFIVESFGESVSKGWVSRAMTSLHLTSHRASMKKRKYRKLQNPTTLHRFLLSLRKRIDGKKEPSQVVAVDNVRFSHPRIILRSYGPEGGYVICSFLIIATLFFCIILLLLFI